MEIHELNTFSGTPSSSNFLAIDNGTDTGKISGESLLAPVNTRIDNIISDVTEDSEVVDGRLGADGVTYGSLGTAIRTQFSGVRNAFTDCLDFTLISLNIGHYINTNQEIGQVVDYSSPGVSGVGLKCAVVNCAEGDAFTLYGDGGGSARLWAFIDSSDKLLSHSGAYETSNGLVVVAPTNSAKCIINTKGYAYKGRAADMRIKELDAKANAQLQFNAKGVYPLGVTWEQGGLGTSTGNEYSTNNAIRTGFMDLLESNYLIARFNATGSFDQWKMYFYQANKAFISVKGFTSNGEFVQTVPSNAKYVRLQIEYWTSPLTPTNGAWLEYLGVRYNIPSNIPNYFVNNLKTAEEAIREHEADCSFNGDSLIFLTDTHYSAEYLIDEDISSNAINANHSIPLVLDVIKNTGVRFTAFGGDLLNACDGVDRMMQSISIFNDSFGCNKFRLMSIVGNHEYYTDLDDESLGRPTASQLYGGLIKINEDVILGRDAFNDYYFDNPIQKIRYFMISCGRDTELDNAQAEWFMDELTKVPNGYNIIVIGHAFLLDDMSAFRLQHLNMMEALDAVTARSSYTFNGNTYDYSALQNVTVICVLTGHTHKDGYLSSEGGTLCICTTCDSYKRQGGGITRAIGTVNEQAFDVVQFDFDNRKIYCTRIGYGSDREFSY